MSTGQSGTEVLGKRAGTGQQRVWQKKEGSSSREKSATVGERREKP